MKFPIIEFREQNFFVLNEFDGKFKETLYIRKHNFQYNKTKHVIDSNGTIWQFKYKNTNHNGVRRVFSTLIRNISFDYYSYNIEKYCDIDILRILLSRFLKSKDTEFKEMASALLEEVDSCDGKEGVRENIKLLKL